MKKSNRQRRPFVIRPNVIVNGRDYSDCGKMWKSSLPFNTLDQVKMKYSGYETRQKGKRIYNAFFLPGLCVKFIATHSGKIIRAAIAPTIEEFYIWAKSNYAHNLEYSHAIHANLSIFARNKTLYAPDNMVFLITTVIIPEFKISKEIMAMVPITQYRSIIGEIKQIDGRTIIMVNHSIYGRRLNYKYSGLKYTLRRPERGGYQIVSVPDTYFGKCNVKRMQLNPHPDQNLF